MTLFGTCGGGDGLEAFQNFPLIHAYKIDALGYCLVGRYQKADPFLWNNDFEERNLAAAIDLDLPLAGQLTFGFKYANALTGIYPVQPQRENHSSNDINDVFTDGRLVLGWEAALDCSYKKLIHR